MVSKLRMLTMMMVHVGSTILNGSSKKSRNWPMELIETSSPMMIPHKIDAKLLLTDSYTVNFKTYFLLSPIDLSTPSSHCESLILACTVKIS